MKKLLSVVLVVTMLLSMVVVGMPAVAAATTPTGSAGTTSATPVGEDFDFEGTYPAEEGWKAITSLADLQAIKVNEDDGFTKYYLKNDITLTGIEDAGNNYVVPGWNQTKDIIFEGNGFTITYDNCSNSIFGGGTTKFEARNLNLVGTMPVPAAHAEHVGALVMHGFDGGITLTNVHADIDITFAERGEVQFVGAIGGLVGKEDRAFVAENVSFTGTIDATALTNTNATAPYRSIGGIVGSLRKGDARKINDVTVDATIIATGAGIDFIGGVAGYGLYATEITNATVKADITAGGASEKYVGGVIGYSAVETNETAGKIDNVVADVKITADIGAIAGVGGIVGGADNTTISTVKTTGTIDAKATGRSGFAGIVGYVKGNTVTVNNVVNGIAVTANAIGWDGGLAGIAGVSNGACKLVVSNTVNNGALTGNVSVYTGGIAGILWGAEYDFDNCVNNAALSTPNGGDTGGIAGVLNNIGTIDNCVNNGAITAKAYAAGIVGQFYQGTSGAIANCGNTGVITDTNGNEAAGIVYGMTVPVTIDSCINKGTVTAAGGTSSGIAPVSSNATITNSVDASVELTDAADIALAAKLEKVVFGKPGSTGTTAATPVVTTNGTTAATPVAEDFDYATAYPEADGWKAVSNLDELKAMTFGGKYYLTNSIEITGITTATIIGTWGGSNITIAGNGHTLTWKDGYAALFSGANGNCTATVTDLNLAGTLTVSNAGEAHIAPLFKHGVDGTMILENVHSSVTINFAEGVDTVGGSIGGVVGKVSGKADFDNVSFTGTINATAKETNADWDYVGGILGYAQSVLGMDNIIVTGTVNVTGEGYEYVGAIAGKVSGNAYTVTKSVLTGTVTAPEGVNVSDVGVTKDGVTAVVTDTIVPGFWESKFPAADGWIAVSDLDGLKAIEYDKKYYLTNDIVITGTTGALIGGWPDGGTIEIAGNGYSLIWQDCYSSLVNGGGGDTKLIIRDLNLAGTMKVDGKAENVAPLVQHNIGTAALTNVHSSVNVVFAEEVVELHNVVGGMIGKMDGGVLTANNVSYTGSMIFNADQKEDYAPGIGGIVGAAFGTVNVTDVVVDATISVGGSGNSSFGGVAGIVGTANINRADVDVEIAVTGANVKNIGGLVGKANGEAGVTVSGVAGTAIINNAAQAANNVGGVVGSAAKVTLSATVLDGEIITTGDGAVTADICPNAEIVAADDVDVSFGATGSAGTTWATPVEEGFDFATKYPEADGWKAVTNLDELKAMAGTSGKYYLTKDIEVTGNDGFNNWQDNTIEFAGNGFTLTWVDSEGTIFGGGTGSLTVYDLNLAGTFKVDSEMRENAGPLLKHGYTGGTTLTNVHSTVNIVFTENVKEIKNAVGGIIGKSEGATTLNNVSYKGTITVSGEQSQTYTEGIGGIAGGVTGNLTAKDVISEVTINANVKNTAYVGAIVGKCNSGANITNATVGGTIKVDGEGTKAVGGLVGVVGGDTFTVTNALVYVGLAVSTEGAMRDMVGTATKEGVTLVTNKVETADYEEKYPVADGWKPVYDLAGLKAVGNNGGKYYLVKDLDITDNSFAGWKDAVIEFAGNGFTLTWVDTDATIFGGGGGSSSLKVSDLNLAGTYKVDSNFENAGPLLKHGYAGGATLTNVHSTINVVFTENVAELKNAVGGIIAKSEGPTVLTDVSYKGTITVLGKQLETYAPGIGGVAGAIKGALTAENVVVDAKINVNMEGAVSVGAVVGAAYGDATIKGLTAKAVIAVEGEGDKTVGGAFGQATNITLESWDLDYDGEVYGKATSFTDKDHVCKFDQKVVDDKYKATDATCVAKATYYKSCECGAKGEETFETGEKDPANHTKDTFTYTNDGDTHTKKNECCGAVVEAGVAHTYGDDDKCVCGAEKPVENNNNNDNNNNNNENNNNNNGEQSESETETTADTDGGNGKKKCGSTITGAAIVLSAVIALGAGVSFKKKED